MDENTWRFAQFMMWLMGIQTTIIIAALAFIWNNLSKRADKLEDRMTRLENDMIEVKTILRMKECCMISDERQLKKVE
jgi:hypothetical protein